MEPFDPSRPLPGPPEPWRSTDMPSLRGGPPFHMTDMIRAEPELARRVLVRLADPAGPAAALAAAVRTAAGAGRPILLVGCGTSEHGAQAAAEILREAGRAAGLPAAVGSGGAPAAVQAFEAALETDLVAGSLLIAISHAGATWATNRALEAGRAAGATTAVITVGAGAPAAALADIVVTTGELDQSWCHTIGYLSPVLAAAAVGAQLDGQAVDPDDAAGLLADGLESNTVAAADSIAAGLKSLDRLLVVGSGIDRVAARELALKIEEGAHQAAVMRDLETLLHGHLAAADRRTGLILVLAERSGRGPRTARAIGLLRACRALGMPAAAILAEVVAATVDPDLTPVGRIAVRDAWTMPAAVAGLLATTAPLQVLTERLALARNVNPDQIRRDEPAHAAAAAAVDG